MNAERLRREGIIWTEVEKYPMSAYDDAFISNEMVIALCLGGESKNYFDMLPVSFKPRDISVMLPNHIISKCESTDEYRALLVILSRDIYNDVSSG